MKQSVLIITLLTFFSSFGQELKDFKKTDDYFLTKIDSITSDKYWKNFSDKEKVDSISVFLKNRKKQILFEIKISELETYSGTTVEVLKVDNLKNIKEIIHLESGYDACCTSYYSTYLLKTKEGGLIELPETEHLHCDGPTPITEYRFPNQKFGLKSKILLTKSFLNDKYEVNSVELQKTYIWDGKTFKLEK